MIRYQIGSVLLCQHYYSSSPMQTNTINNKECDYRFSHGKIIYKVIFYPTIFHVHCSLILPRVWSFVWPNLVNVNWWSCCWCCCCCRIFFCFVGAYTQVNGSQVDGTIGICVGATQNPTKNLYASVGVCANEATTHQ